MIDVASRAVHGVHVPNRKATRAEIMDLFKKQMTKLKERLNVSLYFVSSLLISYITQSKIVKGEVNLTCDAWQASNIDGYFAVTGHWIEEVSSDTWELQCAVLGFTQLNNSHNGQRLGQALYGIVDRVGIAHKVSSLRSCPTSSLIHHRLAILCATMQATTTQCLTNLHIESSEVLVRHGYQTSAASGKVACYLFSIG